MAITCTTENLSTLAACFNCLSIPQLEAIQTYLLCQVQSSSGGFEATAVSFSGATLYTFPHSLGAQPKYVHAVMVNQSTNNGYTAGQELDCFSLFHTASGTQMFAVYADTTNVYVSLREAMPSGAADAKVNPAGGGVSQVLDWTLWKLKVYAHL